MVIEKCADSKSQLKEPNQSANSQSQFKKSTSKSKGQRKEPD